MGDKICLANFFSHSLLSKSRYGTCYGWPSPTRNFTLLTIATFTICQETNNSKPKSKRIRPASAAHQTFYRISLAARLSSGLFAPLRAIVWRRRITRR